MCKVFVRSTLAKKKLASDLDVLDAGISRWSILEEALIAARVPDIGLCHHGPP